MKNGMEETEDCKWAAQEGGWKAQEMDKEKGRRVQVSYPKVSVRNLKKYPTFWRSWAAKSLLAAELQQVSWVSYRDLLYSLLDFRAWKGNEIITPALGYTF